MMKLRKAIAVFLAVICIATSFGVSAVHASNGARTVYASTSTSVAQGNGSYLNVMIDDLSDLASLSVSVYYDTDVVTVIYEANEVSCPLYDSSVQDGCVQFSYIFDGEGSSSPTNLFYFYYEVKEDADLGDAYFDIVVNEAYDSTLEACPAGGSRCFFTVAQRAAQQKCYVYADSYVYTSVEDEFEISYSLSSYEIASGSFAVSYDPERFEVVSYTLGDMLEKKITDVNTALAGSVYVSFVGLEYAGARDLITVKFRTTKNVEETSDISLNVTELCNLDLKRFACEGYTTHVNISYDNSYVKDLPAMRVNAAYSEETDKVTAIITIDKGSRLGAGDFVLSFDPRVLAYESCEKQFNPTFFNINDKNAENGAFKFMIVSLEDIVEAQTVITVVFDVISNDALSTALTISGSGLTDSLTNGIALYFESSNVTLKEPPPKVTVMGDIDYAVEGNKIIVPDGAVLRAGYLKDDSYVAIDPVYNLDGTYSFVVPRLVSEVVVLMLGDLNGNNRLTAADCAILNAYVLQKIELPKELLLACDVNGDGIVDENDIFDLVSAALGQEDLEW